MSVSEKHSGDGNAGDVMSGFADAVPELALRIEKAKSVFGGAAYYHEWDLPEPARVRPFAERTVAKRLLFNSGKGAMLGDLLEKDAIASFAIEAPAGEGGMRHRVRIGKTPVAWDPAQGGSPLRGGGTPDKYMVARIPIDEQGNDIPGNDWELLYGGERLDEIGIAPGMPLSRFEPRPQAAIAADPAGPRAKKLEIKEAFPRHPERPVLLFPPGSIVQEVTAYL